MSYGKTVTERGKHLHPFLNVYRLSAQGQAEALPVFIVQLALQSGHGLFLRVGRSLLKMPVFLTTVLFFVIDSWHAVSYLYGLWADAGGFGVGKHSGDFRVCYKFSFDSNHQLYFITHVAFTRHFCCPCPVDYFTCTPCCSLNALIPVNIKSQICSLSPYGHYFFQTSSHIFSLLAFLDIVCDSETCCLGHSFI